MNSAVWGPTVWKICFDACFRLPRAQCVRLFGALEHLLPCEHCRKSYKMHLARFPPDKSIDDAPLSAAKYCFATKDYVNGKLGQRAAAVPFSVVCARNEVFHDPVTRHDVLDALACIAVQLDSEAQVQAYREWVDVMEALLRSYGLPDTLRTPIHERYRSPATLWLHALACKNDACTVRLTRDDMLKRYRRDPPPAPTGPRAQTARRSTKRRRG